MPTLLKGYCTLHQGKREHHTDGPMPYFRPIELISSLVNLLRFGMLILPHFWKMCTCPVKTVCFSCGTLLRWACALLRLVYSPYYALLWLNTNLFEPITFILPCSLGWALELFSLSMLILSCSFKDDYIVCSMFILSCSKPPKQNYSSPKILPK